MGRDGRIIGDTPDWITTDAGRAAFAANAGNTVFSAKETVVERLAAEDLIDGEPKKIMHPVNFYEKGDKPLEVSPRASGTTVTVAATKCAVNA